MRFLIYFIFNHVIFNFKVTGITTTLNSGFILQNNHGTALNGWLDFANVWKANEICKHVEPFPEKYIRYNQSMRSFGAGVAGFIGLTDDKLNSIGCWTVSGAVQHYQNKSYVAKVAEISHWYFQRLTFMDLGKYTVF